MKKRILSLFLAFIFAFLPLVGCSEQAAVDSIIGNNDSAQPSAANEGSTDASSADVSDISADYPQITGSETLILGDTPLDEEGWYSEKEEVALYIMIYGKLPSNFITKKDAQSLGWQGGSLEDYAPGFSIGGDHFGNHEGALPDGETYTECDIGTQNAKKRGAKRIIFSDSGLIFYTEDHYETFVQLLAGE